MSKSAFDLTKQNTSVDHKIVVALERIAEAFRVLLWEEAKKTGLSPIQIQILMFLNFHEDLAVTPSYVAREFNVTKATITDSLRILVDKELITREKAGTDARSYYLRLTSTGRKVARDTSAFTQELQDAIKTLSPAVRDYFYEGLYGVVSQLNKRSIISAPRMCQNCQFFGEEDGGHYCYYLQIPLPPTEMRVDCPEFEEISSFI
jgi:DNA-binding MarR family transcriptional regulator